MSARPFSRTSTCGSREPVERIWLSLSCSTSHQERYGESTLNVAIVPARRLAVLVEHAQRDHRARAAVGDELRGCLVDLGAHRAAAVVHRALRRARPPRRPHRGCCAASSLSPSTRSTPRQRLSATVLASLKLTPSKFSVFDRDAVDGELDASASGSCWIAILIEAIARRRIGLGREPADAGRQRRRCRSAASRVRLRRVDALAHGARAARCPGRAARRPRFRCFCGSPPALHEFERRVRFEARAFDDDFDAAIGGEAGGILAGIERLIRTVALDVHAALPER